MPFERPRYTDQQEPGSGDNDPAGTGINIDDYAVEDDTAGPIGVPDDYVATVPYQLGGGGVRSANAAEHWAGKTHDVAPRYFDGDEYAPGSQSPSEIVELQRAMARIGLLGPNTRFRLGVWDEPTAKAYRSLLAYSNQQGVDFRVAMMNLISTGGNYTVDKFGNIMSVEEAEAVDINKLPTKTTDPEELKMVFRQAVIDTLGQGWSEDKLQQMAAQYNQMEIKQQRAQYQAEVSGGNVVQVPTPEAFAVNYAEQKDPIGAQTEDFLGQVDQFAQAISSPAWGVG